MPLGLRSALAVEAFRHTAAYDARIAAELPCRMQDAGIELPDEPGLPSSADPYPASLTISLEKVETLRYGENPHQPAARYRAWTASRGPSDGPFAVGRAAPPGQGPVVQQRARRVGGVGAGRLLRGPAVVIVKHTNPCGAAERADPPRGLGRALSPATRCPRSGAWSRSRAPSTGRSRSAWPRSSSRSSWRPAFDEAALAVLATKPNLRLVVDPALDAAADRSGAHGARPARGRLPGLRAHGRAARCWSTAPDNLPDDPADWACLTTRQPTDAERRDLDLAWRLCRGVVSNAIVLVRDGMLVGLGSGQVSRVDACRNAVEKARQFQGEAGARGAVAASDAFFPFADGPQLLLDAGVTAIVQPGRLDARRGGARRGRPGAAARC